MVLKNVYDKENAKFDSSYRVRTTTQINDYSGSSISETNPLPVSNKEFNTNDIDEASSTITYIGLENNASTWYIKKIDTSSNVVFGHATISNNPLVTNYNDAWTNRATLTYENYGDAF